MLWITLMGDENFSLKDIEKVNHIGAKRSYYCNDMTSYIVAFDDVVYTDLPGFPQGARTAKPYDGLQYYYKAADDTTLYVLQNYTKEEIASIPFEVKTLVHVAFRYKETMKRILRQPDFPQNIYVSDEGDSILPLQEFNKFDWDVDKGNIPPQK